MKYLIYFAFYLASALFQTVMAPYLLPRFAFYDPLIVIILFLAGKERFAEGCFFSIVAGLLMDGISGGGIGFYVSSYIWFFIIARWTGMYLRIGSGLITILMSLIGVAVQNFVFFLPEFAAGSIVFPSDYKLLFIRSQLLWALFTSYGLYTFFSGVMDRFAGRSRSVFGKGRGLDDQELIRG